MVEGDVCVGVEKGWETDGEGKADEEGRDDTGDVMRRVQLP